MGVVNFYVGSKSSFDALVDKDPDSLYFTTDTLQFYKGADEYSKSVKIVSTLPSTGQEQGVIYANLSDFSLWVYNGFEYTQINKSYATSISDPGDDSSVPTTKAVVDYVTSKVEDVVGKTGTFVTSVTYDQGVLSVAKGDEPIDTVLTGVVNNPIYVPETRTIKLPVYGGDELDIELGRDLVVDSGSYDPETQTIELVLTSGDVINIPASSLVDIYTGIATSTAVTTVSSDNKISVDVRVSAVADNSITIEDDGIYLSLANYYSKDELDQRIGVIEDKLEDHLADTSIHVTAEEKELWDSKISEEELQQAKDQILDAAASDATTKAAAALEAANDYTDEALKNMDYSLEWKTIED